MSRKTTAVLIAAAILLAAWSCAAQPEEKIDPSSAAAVSEEASTAEESEEESCAHTRSGWWEKTPEEYPAPEGAYGTELSICSYCSEQLDERTLWYDERGIVYFVNENGGCTVRRINCDKDAAGYDIPDIIGGKPVTVLDAYVLASRTDFELGIPASVELITEGAVNQLMYCVLKIDETNPYYAFSGGCLIDRREKAVIMHSLILECVIPDDGSVTKIAHGGLCEIWGTVRIPVSVTEIYGDSFKPFHKEPITIEVDPENEFFTAAGNCLIDKRTKTLIAGFDGFEIPRDGSVTRIGENAFNGKSVSYKDKTELFMPACIEYIGPSAMSGINNISTLIIEDLAAWCNIEFADSGSTPVRSQSGIKIVDAYGKEFGGTIKIPDTVTEIGNYTFYGWKNIDRVELHDNITRIGDLAFCDTAITEIALPESLRELGTNAFANCRLTSIRLPAGLMHIGMGCFWNCPLKSLSADFENNGVFAVKDGCVIDIAAKTLLLGCAESAVPSDGSVKTIGPRAFAIHNDLTEIVIPASVETVGDMAYYMCKNLKKVIMEEGVKTIESGAFANCGSLEEITLPKSMRTVAADAFTSCRALKKVYAHSGTEFDENAFQGIDPPPEIVITD